MDCPMIFREWYDRVFDYMRNFEIKVGLYDKSLFMWNNESGLKI